MTIYQTHPLAALYIDVGGDDDDDDDDRNYDNEDDNYDKYDDDDDERNVWGEGEGGIARLNQKPTVLSLSQ